jgi:hypothetical protein
MTAPRSRDRWTGILSDARGGLLTFLIEAAVVVVAILVALGLAASVLLLV